MGKYSYIPERQNLKNIPFFLWYLPCGILNGYSDDGALCSKANRHVQSLGCTSGDGGEYLKQWSKMQQLLCCLSGK